MRLTRRIATLATILTLALVTSSVASAAPTNAPKGEIVEITCDNGETYTVAVNGNGPFTPGHIIETSNDILIPVAFTFTATDSAGNVIFEDSIAKPGQMHGVQADLFTCTFSGTAEEDGEVITFSGTVSVFLAPRGR